MNLQALLRPVADVMDLAGEAVAAAGIATADVASRWLPPARSGDHAALHLVATGSGPGTPPPRTTTPVSAHTVAVGRPDARTRGPGRAHRRRTRR